MAAEGHEDSLPDLPRRKLIEQPLVSKSRQHTLSAPGVSLYDTRSPVSSRCSSPRLKRSLDLIRISRNEWEQRERTLSTLRADKNELNSMFRQQSDLEKRHQLLQKACLQLAHLLGCTALTEVSGETMSNVVYPRAVQLTADSNTTRKQVSTSNEDLAKARGELSSVSARLTSSETQLQQLRTQVSTKDAEIQRLKNEVEQLRQLEARSSSMVQTLRDQMKQLEGRRKSSDNSQCESQNQITILKQQLEEKNNEIALFKDKENTWESEKTELQERCLISDAAYEEMCIHLADTLQIDQSDSCDFERMTEKVQSLVDECSEYKLKIESLAHLNQVTELDSKANRETILRLVADVKKYEEQSVDTTELQKTLAEVKEKLETAEKDKTSLTARLSVAQSSVTALQQELNAKEKIQQDLKHVIETLKMENRREEIDSLMEPYMKLCGRLRDVLKCSSDEMILASVNQLTKDKQDLERQLMSTECSNRDTLKKLQLANEQLNEAEEDLVTERSKVIDMKQSVEMCEVLQGKVQELNEKHEHFLKRLIKHLKVESGTILVGDFAEDAALVRIEQLSKLESQAVLEKQSAYYSMQRKLKSCRQQLEAKELQLGLSQRKATALEARLSEMAHKEIEWNATIDKGKRVERQLERLQEKIMRQQETIGNLKMESESLERLKLDSQEREEKMARQQAQIESLQQNKIHLSQQLAEARHKAQTIASQDKERAEKTEEQLEDTQRELTTAMRVKNELLEFKSDVKRLISSAHYYSVDHPPTTSLEQQEDVLIQLEKLILACNRYREMSNSLQASLRQLEMGFKRGYQDTWTLLNTNSQI